MRQSFFFIYFVLYLVALVALLPASGGGRIPCNQLADSLLNAFAQPVALDVPRAVRIQLPRLTMGDHIIETKPASAEIRVYLTGMITEDERRNISYDVQPLEGAPPMVCTPDSTTGVGIIRHTFQRTGRFRYALVGKFRRHLPASLPQCIREMLNHLEGTPLEARDSLEVHVEATDFRTPC